MDATYFAHINANSKGKAKAMATETTCGSNKAAPEQLALFKPMNIALTSSPKNDPREEEEDRTATTGRQ